MAPFKWGFRGVWHVLGITGLQGSVWYDRGENEGTSSWEYLPMKLCVPPTIIVVQ